MRYKLAIVLPSFNEQPFLRNLLVEIRKYTSSPILIIDDGSNPPLKIGNINNTILLRHRINLGKGAAMLTGADYAFKILKVQAIIFMDSDGQHDPKYLPEFIKLVNQNYDIVFSSRTSTSGVPLVRYLGNKFASIYINLLFGAYISDILSGYRALNETAFQLLRWESSRYGVETELVARLGKHKNELKYTETPISTIYIDKYKGVTILDAVKILINSLWWKLS